MMVATVLLQNAVKAMMVVTVEVTVLILNGNVLMEVVFQHHTTVMVLRKMVMQVGQQIALTVLMKY